MADLRDEFGNPIKLTDDSGNPVQLTDEHGNPVHIKGVATVVGDGGGQCHGGTLKDMFKKDETAAAVSDRRRRVGKIGRDSDSSSSSSEDDGMGGRRKKGLKDKLKEKLNMGQEAGTGKMTAYPAVVTPAPAPAYPAVVTPAPATATAYPAESLPHEKKSMLEKIKEKLPGHHHGH